MKSIIILFAVMFAQVSSSIGRFIGKKLRSQRGTLDEPNYLDQIVRWSDDENFYVSRETVTILAGQVLKMGTVIGLIAKSTPVTGVAGGGNGGGGTIASVVAGAVAKIGTYTIKALTATTFRITDPDGNIIGDEIALGAFVNEQIHFTITQGSPVIETNDSWTVALAVGAGTAGIIDFAAVNGIQDAYGILIENVDTTLGVKKAGAVVQDAFVIEANLIWPTGATVAQKAGAMAKLRVKRIKPVNEA